YWDRFTYWPEKKSPSFIYSSCNYRIPYLYLKPKPQLLFPIFVFNVFYAFIKKESIERCTITAPDKIHLPCPEVLSS
ncbi:MAG TPA: hypothetical protein PLJ29_13570, partial [Leptospiraceae bacterium]|nr:hypothetical protein [Leptospiraceae bacterium]